MLILCLSYRPIFKNYSVSFIFLKYCLIMQISRVKLKTRILYESMQLGHWFRIQFNCKLFSSLVQCARHPRHVTSSYLFLRFCRRCTQTNGRIYSRIFQIQRVSPQTVSYLFIHVTDVQKLNSHKVYHQSSNIASL